MSVLNQDYSSVAINYDYASTNTLSIADNQGIGQQFVLPVDYIRGSNINEQRIPDISGFQILVNVADADIAGFNWSIGYSEVTDPTVVSQFTFLQEGIVTGTYKTGNVWFDVIFDQSIEVTTNTINLLWLVWLVPTNINTVSYIEYGGAGFDYRNQGFKIDPIFSSVNPEQYQLDALPGAPASFNFRILSLSADSGIDFLGNQYRSVVSTTPANNLNAINSDSNIGGIGNYWISPALPAPDAVASLYFDMRPLTTVPQFGLTNLILDPSFEYDSGTSFADWTTNIPYGTLETFAVRKQSTPYGVQVMHLVVNDVPNGDYTQATTISHIPVQFGTQYSGGVVILFNTDANAYGILQYDWYSGSEEAGYTYISSSYSDQQVSPTTAYIQSVLVATSPINATAMKATITIFNISGSTQNLDVCIDGIIVIQGDTSSPYPALYPEYTLYPSPLTIPSAPSGTVLMEYFDGDTPDCEWIEKPGDSASVQLINIDMVLDQEAVSDALVIEPIFANQNYTLYYSNDDNDSNMTPTTTEEWESKLWTRATSVTTNFGNETQVLPSPVAAQYYKIELTNPQIQQYDPGPFQLPIKYYTFPSWVQNYFLSQVQYPSYNTDQVVVQNDALSTLYTPYLNDLIQQPEIPNVPVPTTYTTSSPNNQIDNTTLGQIDLTVAPYQDTLGTQADPSTTLGSIAINQTNNTIDGAQQLTEGEAPVYPDITTVSSLQRDSVLAEQFAPDMYFYYTCRHSYMQKSATLVDNKAYFFGINNVTFLRSQGTVIADVKVYTETGSDMINASLNDFTVTSQGWWETYATS